MIGYEYNLANEQTKITYPNGKAVNANTTMLAAKSVTDWLGNTTKFSYNADSDLKTTDFPSDTGDEDTYAYNDADQMTEVKMDKGTETLASLAYTRDKDGQVTKTTPKVCPALKSRKTPTTKTIVSRNTAAPNTNTTPQTTPPKRARAKTRITKATSSKKAAV